ncbi:DUF7535 family protein [Haloarchaeobius sp. HRN-SO-5]|uniref:DUF7535 family protein n=1 Tax=Haloarchaeobius sp. HRN-SO-5 TaxID=3446118 RepID=UPI003EBAC971
MPESVSDASGLTTMPEMGLIGYLVAAGCAIVLLPLVPIAVVVWVVLKVVGGGEGPATDSRGPG